MICTRPRQRRKKTRFLFFDHGVFCQDKAEKRWAVYAFAVRPGWLQHVAAASPEMKAPPLADFSRCNLLRDAAYDAQQDRVVAERQPRFGPLQAALPRERAALSESGSEASSAFAALLLEGAVLPALLPLAPHLLLPPRAVLLGNSNSNSNNSNNSVLLPVAHQQLLRAMRGAASLRALRALPDRPALARAAAALYAPATRPAALRLWSDF